MKTMRIIKTSNSTVGVFFFADALDLEPQFMSYGIGEFESELPTKLSHEESINLSKEIHSAKITTTISVSYGK